MYKEIVLQELLLSQDLQYQKFNSSLIPGTDNIIGVRVPILRNTAKKLVTNNWQEYLDEVLTQQDSYHEETIIQGLIIATAKIHYTERLRLIQQYLPKISNWAQCDIFCSTLKEAKKYPNEYWKFISHCCKDQNTYIIRFGVVILLTYYTDRKYTNDALELLHKINHDDYYVRMAVAWAISIFYIKQPELTLPLILDNSLDLFTHNKAIQKICESFRVSKEDKSYLKTLKKTL